MKVHLVIISDSKVYSRIFHGLHDRPQLFPLSCGNLFIRNRNHRVLYFLSGGKLLSFGLNNRHSLCSRFVKVVIFLL